MFDGEKFQLGDKEFIIPSLSVKQARKFWPVIIEMDKHATASGAESLEDAFRKFPELLDKAMPLIHAAIQRNYPDVKLNDLEDLIDVRNFRSIMRVIAGQSGLQPGQQTPGESRPEVVM